MCVSLSLAAGGQIFSWGQNKYGQLGLGSQGVSVSTPQVIQSLQGVPFAQISAGGAHSFGLTLSGAIFGWGRNKFGQLGLNDNDGNRKRLYGVMCVIRGVSDDGEMFFRSMFSCFTEDSQISASGLCLLWRRSHCSAH